VTSAWLLAQSTSPTGGDGATGGSDDVGGGFDELGVDVGGGVGDGTGGDVVGDGTGGDVVGGTGGDVVGGAGAASSHPKLVDSVSPKSPPVMTCSPP
jgi:hypothetical protein